MSAPRNGTPQKIPLVDTVAQYHMLKKEIDAKLKELFESGQFILGPFVETFEEKMADYLGVPHAVGVASCSDALVLGLMALGIGEGDEVITTSYSFFATVEAILRVGARPVFVDIDPQSYALDVTQIEAKVTQKTKAILPVHLFGQCASMKEIGEIAKKHRLKVIEDVAQALGARYQGKRAGTFGDVACLSFFPTKNLGGFGDGGMLVTPHDEVADKVRQLRVHGAQKKGFHETIGMNSRLDALQAAILTVKLTCLDRWNEERRRIAQTYTKALSGKGLILPSLLPDREHVFHQYAILYEGRDALQSHLTSCGIETGIFYPRPFHLQEACRPLGYREGDFPVSEKLSRISLTLPIYPGLSPSQIQEVVGSITSFLSLGSGKARIKGSSLG